MSSRDPCLFSLPGSEVIDVCHHLFLHVKYELYLFLFFSHALHPIAVSPPPTPPSPSPLPPLSPRSPTLLPLCGNAVGPNPGSQACAEISLPSQTHTLIIVNNQVCLWFSNFLTLWPCNTVPHTVVTPQQKNYFLGYFITAIYCCYEL